MINFSLNNITQIRAYEDVRNNYQYLEITYIDLDNNVQKFIYCPQINQYNVEGFGIKLGALLALLYTLFDYCDERNEFYKLIYRFNLEIMRRGHYFMDIIDRNQQMNISINMKDLEKSTFVGDDIRIRVIRTDDGVFTGLDSNGNETVIPNTSIQIYKIISVMASNVILDFVKEFEMCVLQLPNVRFVRDYNALQKTKNLFIVTTTPSKDDIDGVGTLSDNNPNIFINLLVDQELDQIDLEAKTAIHTLSEKDNVHIYIKVDTQAMNITLENVIQKINDLYDEYGSNLDGIYLDNIAVLSDDATDTEKEEWEKYYITLKKYCHNYKTPDGNGSIRYYIIGRSEDGNTHPYLVSNYNNPTDTFISYRGDMPGTYTTLGDSYYSKHSIAIIDNFQLTDDNYVGVLDGIYNIVNGLYITSTDEQHPDWNNIDKMVTYLNEYYSDEIDIYPKRIYLTIGTDDEDTNG